MFIDLNSKGLGKIKAIINQIIEYRKRRKKTEKRKPMSP